MGKKIAWLSVLQGWSMLLVVMGHVTLTNVFRDPAQPITAEIERIIYSFHMPLFIFISGWLFYFTCLRKDKSYKEIVKLKLKRLGIPFLFFIIAATIAKLGFASLVKRDVDLDELVNTFMFFKSNPLGEMWFIVTLFILMLMYPVYKIMIKDTRYVYVGCLVSLIIYYCFPNDIGYFQFSKVAEMLPFFMIGIICSKYN